MASKLDNNLASNTLQSNPADNQSPDALAYITEEMYKKNVELVHINKVLSLLKKIDEIVLGSTTSLVQVTQTVVDSIFTELGYMKSGYEIIMLTLLDQEEKVLKIIAISHTQTAEKLLKESPTPFSDTKFPLWATQNLLIKAVLNKKMYVSDNAGDIYVPAIDAEWMRNFDSSAGINTSIVYPLIAKDKALGALTFVLSKQESEIKEEEWTILENFVGAVGIALDNALLFESLRRTTEQLKQANVKLQELDKLKDEFVSLASHELRTPMTVIKDYASVMLEDKTLSESNRHILERVHLSAVRLINIVNDNLDVSKIESGKMEFNPVDFDISKLSTEVKDELLETYTKKNIKLEVQVGNYNVHADRDKIHQVLINLINNAIKFTPNEGTIDVSFVTKDKNLETTVSDTGSGIKPEDMPKLFTKFTRLENAVAPIAKTSGTGLGLYLCQKIVEKSGGTISVQSVFGKGTKFTFSIPLT